ncbi:Copia protein [Lucilia cuprina]|uniref:Copia protein n=1 Tax=Lucilia cuprina TaxID=7375 RepID=A0A0L0CG66_LUCCU|nr:Copia protein [Lucilia cuprina]
MLIESGAPKKLWGEAALMVLHLINRSPTRNVKEMKTPAELWYGYKPSVKKLRIFGCKAYAWIPEQKRIKLDEKNIEQERENSDDVITTNEIIESQIVEEQSSDVVDEVDENISEDSNTIQPEVISIDDNEVLVEQAVDDSPTTFNEIEKRKDRNKWFEAVKEELKSMKDNNVWTLVEKPKDVKTLKSKWVFRIKKNENGELSKYKARLVAKGFLQKHGRDYEETFAPVAKLTTIRIVLAVGVQLKFYFHQMDVKTAFLHGDLKEDIYMQPPEGVDVKENYVCKLNKSLYGLKQSPRCWNEKINNYLIQIGFSRSKHDYCLRFTYCSKQLSDITTLKHELEKRFEMSDCGELKFFLGIKIDYNREDGIMELSQESNINNILRKFDMEQCKPARKPMEKMTELPKSENTNKPYRELLGSLIKKQATVATSSSEAEYIALSAATSEARWLKGILNDLAIINKNYSVTIYEDNQGCIFMSKNTECKRSKHIDIKYHFIRDHLAQGNINVEYVKSSDQLADICTKVLGIVNYQIFRSKLQLSE